jgi:hypothetical protein
VADLRALRHRAARPPRRRRRRLPPPAGRAVRADDRRGRGQPLRLVPARAHGRRADHPQLGQPLRRLPLHQVPRVGDGRRPRRRPGARVARAGRRARRAGRPAGLPARLVLRHRPHLRRRAPRLPPQPRDGGGVRRGAAPRGDRHRRRRPPRPLQLLPVASRRRCTTRSTHWGWPRGTRAA